MFRTINQKFYGILGLLAILFCIGYAEIAYFLQKQSQAAAQGQRIVRVERQIGTLLNLFFEMRFWERAVFTQEFSDAEQRFGTLMAQLKRHLAALSDEPADAAITGKLGPASELLRGYEQDFNRLMQINTEHRLQRTQIDSSYQSLASSILSTRNPVFLKPLFVLTQFQMSYAESRRASDYQALQVVIESLKTKLKRAGSLEVKNAELERFTYTVSHDLKSPLITIQGFLGFLEKDALGGDMAGVKEDCSRIRGAAHRMQELLNDLLELSRIGRLINPPERIPFEEIAREAKEMVSGRMAAKNIRVEIAGGLPIVRADRQRLREALENLLDNAGKYMGAQPEPRIEIGCRQTDEGPVFFVRDNGMRIDLPYHSKVFGLFEKLDPSAEGTGVGLAIVKRIVEVHGGRIWVESKGAGHGSTFCFTLQGDMDSNTREPL